MSLSGRRQVTWICATEHDADLSSNGGSCLHVWREILFARATPFARSAAAVL
jgi:hypothetical protein